MLFMHKKIFLSPLSGVTDLSFRLICRELGAKFCFFEMVDANAVLRNYVTTSRIIKTIKKDSPIAAQLVGSDPSTMLDAAQKLRDVLNMSFLDINSGCPAKKVIKKKAGSYLLKDTKRLSEIIKKLSSNLDIPVTVKLRTGFDKKDPKETQKIVKLCQDSGASMIFIHGRTTLQGYSGEVDYESIRAAKEVLKIPVFGSGNIFNPILAKKMLDETKCDGVLVARGAFGNPWIFKEIENYLKNGKIPASPKFSIKRKVLKKHLSYIDKYKDMLPANKIGFMRKMAVWYMKGLPNATSLRAGICKVNSYDKLINFIDGIKC